MNARIGFGILSAFLLISSCFFPWVILESRSITVSGVGSEGTNFGKPGYLHIIFSILYIVFILINKVWSKRANLFVGAINVAWSVRNFSIISTCHGGECPQKQLAIYLMLLSSILMILAILIDKTEVKPITEEIKK